MNERESQLLQELESLRREIDVKVQQLSQTVKKHQDMKTRPDEVRQAALAIDALGAELDARLRELQELAGLSDEALDELERSGRHKSDDRYTRREIEETPPTGNIRELAAAGLDRLLSLVSPAWLRMESEKRYRLGYDFRSKPLHLVAGVRIDHATSEFAPHRFATMLLVCKDFLEGEKGFDYYAAPTLLGEIAVLGNSIAEIRSLGAEGKRKLEGLQTVDTRQVPSVIYELLVGAAFVRRGIEAEVVPAERGRKSPDLRLLRQSVPIAAECKRRLGLTQYELREAAHVEALYASIRPILDSGGHHCSIEVTFLEEAIAVREETFASAVADLLGQREGRPSNTEWGVLRRVSLLPVVDVPQTRIYSPAYLAKVFGWYSLEPLWDGLLCEVDSAEDIIVDRARRPRCLKWVSVADAATTKKCRGVTSLWAAAAEQVPAGEMGLIYIAYPEGARPYLADARTRHIGETAEKWYHRWSIILPQVVINRLYARPVGHGEPDFIENSLGLVGFGADDTAHQFPWGVFVPE